jgi:hypothetical protein
MPFRDDGTGIFDRLRSWVSDAALGIKIRSNLHDENDDDIAQALSNCMTRNGLAPPTQNLPMGGKRFTGAAASVDPTDFVIQQELTDALGVDRIGDYLTTERDPGLSWLKRDAGKYDQADYPALAAMLGARYGKLAGFTLGSFGGVTTNITAMAYGAGKFVAGGGGGMIRTSPTGVVWTTQTSGVVLDISRIVFLNNQFIATTFGGKILTSPDAVTWTQRTSGVVTDLHGIAYGNGRYIICGASGVILVSPDNGVNWIPKSVAGFTETLYGAAFGNGRYVLVGGVGGGAGGASVTSIDGDTWTMTRTGYGGAHIDLTFGRSVFVAEGGTSAYTSPSGIGAWGAYGLAGSAYRIKFGLNNFIGVGGSFSTSSIDGKAWDTHTPIVGTFFGIAIGPDFAIAGGSGGAIAKSSYAYDTVTEFMVPGDNPDNGYIKAL